MIVGNKCDSENEREVSTSGELMCSNKVMKATLRLMFSDAEGIAISKQKKCHFLEVSAKSAINVDAAFMKLIDEIRESETVSVSFTLPQINRRILFTDPEKIRRSAKAA